VSDCAIQFIERDAAVGAGVDANLAAVAHSFVDQDKAVIGPGDGVDRADRGTKGVIAMSAQYRDKVHMELSAYASRAHGQYTAPAGCCLGSEVMLLPTRDLTRMAPDTTINVYQKNLFR
jgi:hypothetical protein